jgi:hypothetical protein
MILSISKQSRQILLRVLSSSSHSTITTPSNKSAFAAAVQPHRSLTNPLVQVIPVYGGGGSEYYHPLVQEAGAVPMIQHIGSSSSSGAAEICQASAASLWTTTSFAANLSWILEACRSFVWTHPVISLVILTEFIFYLTFRWYVLPYANRPSSTTPPEPFRNELYQTQRHKLLVRVMERLKRRAAWNNQSLHQTFREFLYPWFHHVKPQAVSPSKANSEIIRQEVDMTKNGDSKGVTSSSSSDSLMGSVENSSVSSFSSLEQPSNASPGGEEASRSGHNEGAGPKILFPKYSSKKEDDIFSIASDMRRTTISNETTSAGAGTVYTPLPNYDEARELISWAFFGKHYGDIAPAPLLLTEDGSPAKREEAPSSREEYVELKRLFQVLDDYGIQFEASAASSASNAATSAFFSKEQKSADHATNINHMISNNSNSSTTNNTGYMVPRKLTLEKVDPLFRPLIVYLIMGVFEFLGGLVLRYHGFRKYESTPAHGRLSYWYRPGKGPASGLSASVDGSTNAKNSQNNPFLFFHGIAPAGVTFYIPLLMHLYGNNDNQHYRKKKTHTNDETEASTPTSITTPPMFLFENKCVSYGMSLYPVNEADTAASVVEALQRHVNPNVSEIDGIKLCGHSFGSFQVTWMVHHPVLRPLLRQIILLDPVSILISDPDVMENFIYKRRQETPQFSFRGQSIWQSSVALKHYLWDGIIFWVASTEVYTEHYLRRHFTWYNSELWLEDIPSQCHTWIGLAGGDEIINAPKVKDEIDMTNHLIQRKQEEQWQRQGRGQSELSSPSQQPHIIKTKIWSDYGHAACLTNQDMWKDIKEILT